MKQFETEHYIFHYGEGTQAEADILDIAAGQEACFRYICRVLQVIPDFKIIYYLCDSPEEVGRIYGDDEPCNGFAVMPNTVYAVYNSQVRCVGFHEDAHLVSYLINRPDCPAVREGLAMYFDRRWWGIGNLDWTCYYIEKDLYLPIHRLLDKEQFFAGDCSVTYPIMGAFTEYLIRVYGMKAYLEFYSQSDMAKAMETVFRKTPRELDQEFTEYVRLFRVDDGVKSRMASLLAR